VYTYFRANASLRQILNHQWDQEGIAFSTTEYTENVERSTMARCETAMVVIGGLHCRESGHDVYQFGLFRVVPSFPWLKTVFCVSGYAMHAAQGN